MKQTLFDKYGGFKTFSQITSNFYLKVLDSPQLSPFFKGIDMKVMINHQANFLSQSLGGPVTYDINKDFSKFHAHLRITNEHYNEIIELLTEALEDADVESKDIDYIDKVINSFRKVVVNA
jgi:hemoglobin